MLSLLSAFFYHFFKHVYFRLYFFPFFLIIQVSSPLLHIPHRAQAAPPQRWSLNHIETRLIQDTHLHWIQHFEVGYINWTLRTLHTLGVGTHRILSPTGGWSKDDLLVQAQSHTQKQLALLSQTLYSKRTHPQCDWSTHSQSFQSRDPLFFSDGTVHLHSWISFDLYHECWKQEQKGKWWMEILKESHQGKRGVVTVLIKHHNHKN